MDLERLKKEQLKLAPKVALKDSFKEAALLGGCDQVCIDSKRVISAVVVCDRDFRVVDKAYAVTTAVVPYISNYLFYSEGPAVIQAFSKLEKKPDVLFVNGNGILHPIRIGMASQLGLVLDQATIGVAKKLLCGSVKGGKVFVGDEVRGFEFKSREFSNPLYVSPGHKISREASLKIAKQCMVAPHKLPEPLHLAHRYADSIKKDLFSSRTSAAPSVSAH